MTHPKEFAEGLSIGIIMDGNGRWAKNRGLPRTAGHKKGAEVFKDIANYCDELGVASVYFYAFSTENWKRPLEEVGAIMKLFAQYLIEGFDYKNRNIRIKFLGDRTALDPKLQKMMNELEGDSACKTGMTLNIAVNYGGRPEIVRAARQLAQQGAAYAVVTLKDSAGNILYPSQVAAAAGSIEGASLDLALIASVLKENGLVPVAKLAAFRDPIAARTDRNMAIGYTGQAYLWLDNKASAGGNPWLNPYSDEAVQFIGDLIGEVQSMGFDHVLLENVQFPSAQNGKQDFGSTGGRDRSAQLAADIAAWDARFEGSVTLWYGYSLGQVTDGASTVGGSATSLGVRNLVVEVPAKQTMDDTARSELRDTLSASGVEHAVFWDDAAGIFQ